MACMKQSSLIVELDRVLPGFAEYFRSSDNLFEGESLHAAFASCSQFVCERPVPAAAST
jgi:hypothetical protein